MYVNVHIHTHKFYKISPSFFYIPLILIVSTLVNIFSYLVVGSGNQLPSVLPDGIVPVAAVEGVAEVVPFARSHGPHLLGVDAPAVDGEHPRGVESQGGVIHVLEGQGIVVGVVVHCCKKILFICIGLIIKEFV